ncbi:MAG: hypothetical protein NNC24_02645 [Candidatus Nanosynbacter sp. P11B_S7_bin.28.1]|nr:hypothetical protein [Candidatus Nanosynbacter sp. P11B_S7_bin.28.1]
MTEISKSPEQGVSQESPDGQKATGWESLVDYDNGDSDYTHHSPFGEVPAINGNDLLGSGVFSRDAVALMQNTFQPSSETPEEKQVLLNLGDVYVLVGKDSDPKKLEAAWARAMRGHYDQQITFTEDITDTVESYPLVTTTLDNIPKEILEAEAAEDEAKRRAGDEEIQQADAIINREKDYRRLKDEVWDVELTFGEGDEKYTTNVYGDKQKQPKEIPFDSASEAKISMQRTYAILWAKLMQKRLNEGESKKVADVAEESLNEMGIALSEKHENLFVTDICYELDAIYNWEHCAELKDWYNERLRELLDIKPLPKEAR